MSVMCHLCISLFSFLSSPLTTWGKRKKKNQPLKRASPVFMHLLVCCVLTISPSCSFPVVSRAHRTEAPRSGWALSSMHLLSSTLIVYLGMRRSSPGHNALLHEIFQRTQEQSAAFDVRPWSQRATWPHDM